MAEQSTIKRAVSLFSFLHDYWQHTLSLEGCLAAAAALDIPGIEVIPGLQHIGERLIPGFPNPPDSFFDQWHGWMERYGLTPVCYDMYLAGGVGGRPAGEGEVMQSVLRDLEIARKLGCTVMRMVVNTPPWVMEKAAPYAEQHDVRLGLELQAPLHLDDVWVVRHLEVMDRVNSPYLGFIPDMGLFTRRFPRVMAERDIRDGAHENIARLITARYDNHEPLGSLDLEVKGMGGNEVDLAMVCQAQQQTYWDPRRLLEIMPRVFHVHAKCFEMLPDGTEYSLAYDELTPLLIEGGYDGYLSTEYEGWRFTGDVLAVDTVDQVRRHQAMLKHLLGEGEGHGTR